MFFYIIIETTKGGGIKMIKIVDRTSYNKDGMFVYGLQYDNAEELTGSHLTVDDVLIVCQPGSLAWKVGLTNMKQLSNSGGWEDV